MRGSWLVLGCLRGFECVRVLAWAFCRKLDLIGGLLMCVESGVRGVRVEWMLGVFLYIECLFLGKVGGGRLCFKVKGLAVD